MASMVCTAYVSKWMEIGTLAIVLLELPAKESFLGKYGDTNCGERTHGAGGEGGVPSL